MGPSWSDIVLDLDGGGLVCTDDDDQEVVHLWTLITCFLRPWKWMRQQSEKNEGGWE